MKNGRAGRAMRLSIALVLLLPGAALAGGGTRAPVDGGDLDVLRAVAADARRAWLVQPSRGRPIALPETTVARVRAALADCEPTDPAYTTPPWPDAVVLLEDSRGRRYAFQLAARNVRTDGENPLAPSLRSLTDGAPGARVRDCHPGHAAAAALWAIHRRHLGNTGVRAYHETRDPPVDEWLE